MSALIGMHAFPQESDMAPAVLKAGSMHLPPGFAFVRICTIILFAAGFYTGDLPAAPRTPWLSVTPVPNIDLYGVAFGNGLFVAVGDSGTILTSTDGANWTLRASAAANLRFYAVTYGSNSFVAVGATIESINHPVVWTSPEGITWTPRDTTSLESSWLQGVTYGKGLYVGVGGNYGTNSVAVSTDGISWTLRDSGLSNTGLTPLRGVAYGNGVFVAAGADVIVGGHIHQSSVVERHEFTALAGAVRSPVVLATAPGFNRPRPRRAGEAQGLHVIRWNEGELSIETRIWDGASFVPTGRRLFSR
jgi:hypothetical protein